MLDVNDATDGAEVMLNTAPLQHLQWTAASFWT